MSDKEIRRAKQYGDLVERLTPNSKPLRNCLRAFWVGGVICTLGQWITMLAEPLQLTEMTAPMFTSVVLIFLGATLTGIGVYDRIGKYAGAGSVVPITGFANSVCAPALEFRREGWVLGLGARLFQIAGPVLVYGISSSIVVGLVYWAVKEWLL
ncbi:MAG TPA: stage V sporulation protein AC [Candidatus Pullichristensenella excrementigallinarum]|uniref:Stage V sporulation protein AC n=1 Tax=Candidatus Pullichristensenella excrementigallinarum TaxID=2840907 RepID=A0A9D1LC62_9FIRM|nr:stage V sporulation protein AC [Candidatus Pullichristensenella excrementigallinarum]